MNKPEPIHYESLIALNPDSVFNKCLVADRSWTEDEAKRAAGFLGEQISKGLVGIIRGTVCECSIDDSVSPYNTPYVFQMWRYNVRQDKYGKVVGTVRMHIELEPSFPAWANGLTIPSIRDLCSDGENRDLLIENVQEMNGHAYGFEYTGWSYSRKRHDIVSRVSVRHNLYRDEHRQVILTKWSHVGSRRAEDFITMVEAECRNYLPLSCMVHNIRIESLRYRERTGCVTVVLTK